MKSRYTLIVGLAVIAAVAVVGTAVGGPSLKKLVKKEVAKQVANATGPQGPAGADGADGTARAFASVLQHSSDDCTGGCTFSRSKGVTEVTYEGTGIYCVTAPGISSATVSAVASTDWGPTAGPEGNGVTQVRSNAGNCDAGEFQVNTERIVDPPTNTIDADNVSFTIVIP
jgi:Tfp pilus assembly major pilin PilA